MIRWFSSSFMFHLLISLQAFNFMLRLSYYGERLSHTASSRCINQVEWDRSVPFLRRLMLNFIEDAINYRKNNIFFFAFFQETALLNALNFFMIEIWMTLRTLFKLETDV